MSKGQNYCSLLKQLSHKFDNEILDLAQIHSHAESAVLWCIVDMYSDIEMWFRKIDVSRYIHVAFFSFIPSQNVGLFVAITSMQSRNTRTTMIIRHLLIIYEINSQFVNNMEKSFFPNNVCETSLCDTGSLIVLWHLLLRCSHSARWIKLECVCVCVLKLIWMNKSM